MNDLRYNPGRDLWSLLDLLQYTHRAVAALSSNGELKLFDQTVSAPVSNNAV